MQRIPPAEFEPALGKRLDELWGKPPALYRALANHPAFVAAWTEFARAMRYGGAVGLVMADLDRFKALNDDGGHGAGDRVMEAVAAALRLEMMGRENDLREGQEALAALERELAHVMRDLEAFLQPEPVAP